MAHSSDVPRACVQFDSKVARVEESRSDDANQTKMAKKQASRGYGSFYFGAREASSSEDDEPAVLRRIGGASARHEASDDSDLDGQEVGRFGKRGRFAASGLSVDLRTSSMLPDGVEVVGGDAVFEEQEDGNSALIVPEGAYLKVSLPGGLAPWMLEDDGRLHRYSLLMAVRLDRLPSSAMALFNGSAPATQGEMVDSVYVYKDGGVGTLGHHGVREAAMRAERWGWIVVTRSGNDVVTYVNGRVCAKIDVTVKQPKAKGDSKVGGEGKKKKNPSADGNDADDDGKKGEGEKDKAGGESMKLPERLCIDPQHLALFAPDETLTDKGDQGDQGERGLAVRYLKLSTSLWDPEQVRREMDALRGRDDDADLREEAEEARLQHLSLQPLYAKPPPIWVHPAFAAEFGDAFIGGTGLESGTLHVSLEVVVLALERLLSEGGVAALSTIPHAERAALNSTLASLGEAKRLAHKLAHALTSDGQQRLYLGRVLNALSALEPGAMLPVPCAVGGQPVVLLVIRGSAASADTCTVVVVGCDAEELKAHRCEAHPPKIRFETCLELREVARTKLLDEALWAVVWFAGAGAGDDGKLSAQQIFYQVALAFLTDEPLDRAIRRSDALRAKELEDTEARVYMRTPRRSKSAHYGCIRQRFLPETR